MIFLFAGHHLKDPGASGSGYVERDLTIELRDQIKFYLDEQKARYILDKDTETLAQLMARVKPGDGSVMCDIHFNAAGTATATGTEVFIAGDHSTRDKELAVKLADIGASIIGIRNRGVRTEIESHRGRLAVLHTAGINVLIEVCFISNPDDMRKYQLVKHHYAKAVADALIEADAIIA